MPERPGDVSQLPIQRPDLNKKITNWTRAQIIVSLLLVAATAVVCVRVLSNTKARLIAGGGAAFLFIVGHGVAFYCKRSLRQQIASAEREVQRGGEPPAAPAVPKDPQLSALSPLDDDQGINDPADESGDGQDSHLQDQQAQEDAKKRQEADAAAAVAAAAELQQKSAAEQQAKLEARTEQQDKERQAEALAAAQKAEQNDKSVAQQAAEQQQKAQQATEQTNKQTEQQAKQQQLTVQKAEQQQKATERLIKHTQAEDHQKQQAAEQAAAVEKQKKLQATEEAAKKKKQEDDALQAKQTEVHQKSRVEVQQKFQDNQKAQQQQQAKVAASTQVAALPQQPLSSCPQGTGCLLKNDKKHASKFSHPDVNVEADQKAQAKAEADQKAKIQAEVEYKANVKHAVEQHTKTIEQDRKQKEAADAAALLAKQIASAPGIPFCANESARGCHFLNGNDLSGNRQQHMENFLHKDPSKNDAALKHYEAKKAQAKVEAEQKAKAQAEQWNKNSAEAAAKEKQKAEQNQKKQVSDAALFKQQKASAPEIPLCFAEEAGMKCVLGGEESHMESHLHEDPAKNDRALALYKKQQAAKAPKTLDDRALADFSPQMQAHYAQVLQARQPLINELQHYFTFESNGYYPKDLQQGAAAKLQQDIDTNLPKWRKLFGDIAAMGDAGYAREIRVKLLNAGVVSPQVNKINGQVIPDHVKVKPSSLGQLRQGVPSDLKGHKEPFSNPGQHSQPKNTPYIDAFGYEIWKGYQTGYRYKRLGVTKHNKAADAEYTPMQLENYERRVAEIHQAHADGLLLVRVIDLPEAKGFIGHDIRMGASTILSMSLAPAQGSKITMRLFINNDGKVGVLASQGRIHPADRGPGYKQNAFTVGTADILLLKAMDSSGNVEAVSTLEGQRALLESFDQHVKSGGKLSELQVKRSQDKTGYDVTVQKADARSAPVGVRSRFAGGDVSLGDNTISHNEQTYYRGAIHDLPIGYFVKGNSIETLRQSLAETFEVAERGRCKKGIPFPVYLMQQGNQFLLVVPDPLLLALLGLTGKVQPIKGMQSDLSIAMEKAGITLDEATHASKFLEVLAGSKDKKAEMYRMLLEIPLLMFNMKSIGDNISFRNNDDSYDEIRLLDNLHLVFPTIYPSESQSAKFKKHCFTMDQVVGILNSKIPLWGYYKKSLIYSLEKFLGIPAVGAEINWEMMRPFGAEDPMRTNFARVVSRAMQSLVLLEVFDHQPGSCQATLKRVEEIVGDIRKKYPYLGFSPSGVDMILGSLQMQEILKKKRLPMFNTSLEKERVVVPAGSMPELNFSMRNHQNPLFHAFDAKAEAAWDLAPEIYYTANPRVAIDNIEEVLLNRFGIENGELQLTNIKNQSYFHPEYHEPSMTTYQKDFIEFYPMLTPFLGKEKADLIVENLRKRFPNFAKSASGVDLLDTPKTKWIQSKIMSKLAKKEHLPEVEFPFIDPQVEDLEMQAIINNKDGKLSRLEMSEACKAKQGLSGASEGPELEKAQKAFVKRRMLEVMPAYLAKSKLRARAEELGMVVEDKDKTKKMIWEIEPEFHDGHARTKPKRPYFEAEDLFGAHALELFTGPAYSVKRLNEDRRSFQIHIRDEKQLDPKQVMHYLTATLMVTTEGDKQVIRANGMEFSPRVEAPSVGGNAEWHRANKKHAFQDELQREYLKVQNAQGQWVRAIDPNLPGGLTNYTPEELQVVEDYDDSLLDDDQRQIKARNLLETAYLTVTAKGGYNSQRVSLSRAYRVLMVNTRGPQFEKYGLKPYRGKNRELEAAAHIIKKGAPENKKPLFPEFYPGGRIPSYHEIMQHPDWIASGIGKEFEKPYALLQDGSLFNRGSYRESAESYTEFVLKTIRGRLGEDRQKNEESRPFYLKATLYGGGFFANANVAGNLRPEVLYMMLESYSLALEKREVPPGSTIEFPCYGPMSDVPQKIIARLKAAAAHNQVALVWNEKGDVFDFSEQTTLTEDPHHPGKYLKVNPEEYETNGAFVPLNAGDANSWFGNEKGDKNGGGSVEAMIGNASNGRDVMNVLRNPHAFNKALEMAGLDVEDFKEDD